MAIKNLNKLPKRKITVDELLHSDDITDLLKEIYENRHEIDQFCLVYTLQDSTCRNYWHGTKERIIFALEQAKFKIMLPDKEDKEDA